MIAPCDNECDRYSACSVFHPDQINPTVLIQLFRGWFLFLDINLEFLTLSFTGNITAVFVSLKFLLVTGWIDWACIPSPASPPWEWLQPTDWLTIYGVTSRSYAPDSRTQGGGVLDWWCEGSQSDTKGSVVTYKILPVFLSEPIGTFIKTRHF